MTPSDLWEWVKWLLIPTLSLGSWLARRRLISGGGSAFAWIVRQLDLNSQTIRLNDELTAARRETADRTRERDEAIKGRNDAYTMQDLLRVRLEELAVSTALLHQASTAVISSALPNTPAPSPIKPLLLPPNSSSLPADNPIQIPPS